MLLLVHSQKDNSDVTRKQSSNNSDLAFTSADKVLVVLPQRIDLISTVIVSDSTITTTFMHVNDSNNIRKESYRTTRSSRRGSAAIGMDTSASFNHNSHNILSPHSNQHHQLPPSLPVSLSQPSPSSPLIVAKHRKNDTSILWDQHLAFLEKLGSSSRKKYSHLPLRRYSEFGCTISDDSSCNNNTKNSYNRNNYTLAQYLGTRRASLPVTLSQAWARSQPWSRSYRSQSRSPTRLRASSITSYIAGSPHLFREAFKKAMTVQSPVLTSTSSGMGTLSDMSSSSTLMSPSTLEKKPEEEEEEVEGVLGSRRDQEEIWGAHSCLTKIWDEERSRISPNDVDPEDPIDNQLDDETKVKIKREPSEDAMSTLLYDGQMNDMMLDSSNASMMRDVKLVNDSVSSVSKEDTPSSHSLSTSISAPAQTTFSNAGSRMRSISRSLSPAATPSRSSTVPLPPSHSMSSLPQLQEHVTAHDISLMTASFGALTPLEIQSKFYAQQQRQRSRRLSRRKAITKIMGTQYQLGSSSSAAATAIDPTRDFRRSARHQFQSYQGAEPSIHPFDISGFDKSPLNAREVNQGGHMGARPQLPSYYYLPPSAFRTAADVAAEERREAEQKSQEMDKELDKYFVFLSPMLS